MDAALEVLKEFGAVKGSFVIFFFLAHYAVYKQYKGRLEDRQKEIDRLAADNRDYRDRFLRLMDERFGWRQPQKQKKR